MSPVSSSVKVLKLVMPVSKLSDIVDKSIMAWLKQESGLSSKQLSFCSRTSIKVLEKVDA